MKLPLKSVELIKNVVQLNYKPMKPQTPLFNVELRVSSRPQAHQKFNIEEGGGVTWTLKRLSTLKRGLGSYSTYVSIQHTRKYTF